MSRFLIVSNVENLQSYREIAEEYHMGFEMNDFFDPEVLMDVRRQEQIIQEYEQTWLPAYYTMHGAFFDVTIFSYDPEIREISRRRMKQSMEIARRIGARAVVFHTNVNPFLDNECYLDKAIRYTMEWMKTLLEEYPEIQIYLENMFDDNPKFLVEISRRLVDYENYGVCFDYAHASISNTPLEVWITNLKAYIKHIHINDNDLMNDLHLAVGSGYIDWKEFAVFYENYFKQCTVLIETTLPENQRASIIFLQKCLGLEAI